MTGGLPSSRHAAPERRPPSVRYRKEYHNRPEKSNYLYYFQKLQNPGRDAHPCQSIRFADSPCEGDTLCVRRAGFCLTQRRGERGDVVYRQKKFWRLGRLPPCRPDANAAYPSAGYLDKSGFCNF